MLLLRNMRIFALAAFFCASSCLPALAQEAATVEEGLPQFNTSMYPEQLFWLAVTFTVLYLLMGRVALPRVAATKENRQQIIARELQAAKAANETAQQAMAQVEKSLTEARAQAHAHTNKMMADVFQETYAQQVAQEKELLRKLHRAEADIAIARDAALKNVHNGANDLAAAIVEKIIGARVKAAS